MEREEKSRSKLSTQFVSHWNRITYEAARDGVPSAGNSRRRRREFGSQNTFAGLRMPQALQTGGASGPCISGACAPFLRLSPEADGTSGPPGDKIRLIYLLPEPAGRHASLGVKLLDSCVGGLKGVRDQIKRESCGNPDHSSNTLHESLTPVLQRNRSPCDSCWGGTPTQSKQAIYVQGLQP